MANVDTSGSTSTIAYVTTDGLSTPRAVSNSSGTIVWQWAYQGNPWGETAPTSSGYTYNPRLPGQYFDQETGLKYNVHRDYDSNVGRYIESDPLGTFAGQNSTYAYVAGNPLSYSDPQGLISDPADPTSSDSGYTADQIAEKSRERKEYSAVCKSPIPPTGDKCKDAQANLMRLQRCLSLREAFSRKWYNDQDPGHMVEIGNTQKAIAKLVQWIAENCNCKCQHCGTSDASGNG